MDEKDREALIVLLERHAFETGEFLAAIRARPIAAERVDLDKLPADWQTLRPLQRIANASPSHATARPKAGDCLPVAYLIWCIQHNPLFLLPNTTLSD